MTNAQFTAALYAGWSAPATPAIRRGSQPIHRARRSYRIPVRPGRVYPRRPGQAAPSLGTRIEDAVVGQGVKLGLSFIPFVGPALAPLLVKPVEAALGTAVDVLGGIFGGIGSSPEALTVADYVRLGKLTATPGSPVVDVGIRKGRNL